MRKLRRKDKMNRHPKENNSILRRFKKKKKTMWEPHNIRGDNSSREDLGSCEVHYAASCSGKQNNFTEYVET